MFECRLVVSWFPRATHELLSKLHYKGIVNYQFKEIPGGSRKDVAKL